MNSKVTCRIIGWVYVFLGTIGVTAGHLGTYMQFTQGESYLALGLGIISVLAARRRRRVAAVTALLIGMVCVMWGMSSVFGTSAMWFGTLEPLDVLLRELAAIWGIGTAINDALLWRKLISTAS